MLMKGGGILRVDFSAGPNDFGNTCSTGFVIYLLV